MGEPEPAADDAMERIWAAFFNQVFAIAEDAVRSRKVPLEDVREEEPYLFLGLIGATVLQCVVRSSKTRDKTLLLADGAEGLQAHLIAPHHHAALAVMQQLVHVVPRNHDHLWCLEQLVLYGQSEHKVVTALDDATLVDLRRLAASIQTVALHVSQQPVFRQKFPDVMGLLLGLYREV